MPRAKTFSKLVALPPNQRTKTREQSIVDCEQAFKLRVTEGLTYREIAERTDVSEQTAMERCNYISKLRLEGLIRQDDEEREEMSAQLDVLLSRWWKLANSEKLAVGETKTRKDGREYDITIPDWEAAGTATDKVLRILDQKAKLKSLYGFVARRSPEEAGELAGAMWKAMSNVASTRPSDVDVEVTRLEEADGQERTP